MLPPSSNFQRIAFDRFEADLLSGELRKDARRIHLQAKPFQLLALLLEHPGEVVTREEICRKLWNTDTFVDFDHSLGTAINKIREALGDSADHPRFVETMPRRGYRFIGKIDRSEPQAPVQALTPSSESSGKYRPRPIFLVSGGLLAAFLLLFFLSMRWRRSLAASSNPSHPIMLAVLPFQNLSGDASQDYFSDGLTEELITQLGEVNGNQLGVIARTSSMMYKHTTKDVGQIGRELGVDYVLESSVRRDGDQVRITVQLIYAKTQVHIWANSYDRAVRHSIDVQEEVARAVAQQIRVKLANREGGQRPLNPAANEAYLRGRYFWNQFTETGFRQAASYFDQAVEADPKFASAYSGLSDSYAFLIITNVIPPKEGWPKARVAAQRAVELDGELSDARLSLAHFRMHMWDWQDSEIEFKKTIALDPSNATAHRWYAAYLVSLAKHQQALEEITQAHRLDPLSLTHNAEVVRTLYYGRQYERAVEQARKAQLLDPEFPRTHFWLGRVYAQMGKYPEAIAEADRAGPSPDSRIRVTEMAYACAKAGKSAEALALLKKLQEGSKRGYVPAYDLAVVHLALGEKEAALQWLQRAYDEHDWGLVVLAVEPRLDPLRSDPRFQGLLRKVGLQVP
jgi:TolB-like protein/DNA-binding winged helix-turn-helix (wHTH) protein/tetratricopeptide (TPR) repeat protein